ncbi:hypothetical protein BFT35_09250 [Thermoanaerobacterium thermosaccharolyticum]|uniref:hypothetical protein n=1 Tax=Thermoanaerobacterium thermosaccharolyticum TaxID=1517 RepID=UPI000C080D49|nr:hypothetical protein [Thermoanaerobacterium thermosaccharolyticum]PHO06762.1 hypothetical protein BFT35_09250 [Thermoanaerobacterium thermosaccharolyticum]
MKDNKSNKKNEFEKELDNLKEWEENQYNPGYYIGTGRIPEPIKGVGKYPFIQIIIGLIILIPMIIAVIDETDVLNIISFIIPAIIGFSLIYGGIIKLISMKKIRKGNKMH